MLVFKIKGLQRKLISKKYGFLSHLYLTANPFALIMVKNINEEIKI